MSFSNLDFDLIFTGQSHTSETPSTAHKLLRMTPEEITRVMSKPSIQEAYKRRLLRQCHQIKDLIKEWRSLEEIRKAFLDIQNIVSWPFAKLTWRLFGQAIRKSRSLPKDCDENEFNKLIKLYERERLILQIPLELPNFHGEWGADIISMNATLCFRENNDVLDYIDTIIDMVIAWWDGTMTYAPITPENLESKTSFMNTLFEYHGRNYVFTYDHFDWWAVPKEIFNAIITLLPLHTRKDSKGDVLVHISKESDGLRVSVPLSSGTKHPIKKPGDLTFHSCVGSVDGSFFLDWMTKSFPEHLSFEVSDTMICFYIKTLPT